ncbi:MULTISPECIES: glucose-6-phosphate dehydrogenase [Campylobacter]|uniref:Glucose-6-phosphate 1-dehydrogenase n=1 Tax=Campylobacter jejuni TaxID=197 RepID=A0A431EIF3_CAMJU|nr:MULTISPECIES: glucose-6-phosphate dehydrogenase [Campylobacter]ECL3020157.1 glucose-6-phosphate dehydrogenase [Campylobacter jejuni]EDN5890105.1 glucose-6-phosphate dehydrogenase [Campylobacter jejuni]EDP6004072.1 glucose-6-phosphate dehydrogenase [Campylobacter jejuni]EDP6650186.1 glucose-6-phosphate dehydrogenase [Campylobacter jejuni]RTI62223.1 glucose-6-phosphate dehydrogenase [Campylobacter jejuni]
MKSFDFILFGATGDLAMRKIFPSLYQAYVDGFLSHIGKMIATGRSMLNVDEFKDKMNHKSKIHIKNCDNKKWEEFAHNIDYLSINLNETKDFELLKEKISNKSKNIVIYFSISPEFFIKACKNLASVDLNDDRVKIILEKPLGMDLKSCQAINNEIAQYYNEKQIYRIDHYLGKESIQNLLILRRFNPIFTSLWKKDYIDYVEVSVFETLGVESRGEFYDSTGALRDMIQNHILQILSLVAMKIPNTLNAESIRSSKLQLLKSLKPLSDEDIKSNVIRAQYSQSGEFKGYLDEDHVKENSQTETFVAIKAELLDENWKNVPFYIRTGKRMANSFAQIIICFKDQQDQSTHPNKLIIRLQPENQISLNLKVKKIGKTMDCEENNLILNLNSTSVMQPYERLILDVIEGNQASFNHKEELEAAWTWVDPILENWKNNKTPLYSYFAGSWGPKESFDLIQKDQHEWHNA